MRKVVNSLHNLTPELLLAVDVVENVMRHVCNEGKDGYFCRKRDGGTCCCEALLIDEFAKADCSCVVTARIRLNGAGIKMYNDAELDRLGAELHEVTGSYLLPVRPRGGKE